MGPLRKCRHCGLVAKNEKDLDFFKNDKSMLYNKANECVKCVALNSCKYRKDNHEKAKETVSTYQHSEKGKDSREKYLESTTTSRAKYQKEYRVTYYNTPEGKANRQYHDAKRRATKLSQTPELTEFEDFCLREIYVKAQELSSYFGVQMHVDHIHPLSKGGLHHPDNLQILPWYENLAKGAKLVATV